MAKQIKSLHLVKETQIKENLTGLFTNATENIDSDNLTINNVCLFGRRESANGRTYSDTAIDSIVKLSEGGKCFINHITKQEMKDRSGVRDLRDFVGVFESSRRDGEKVLANLKVREAYWDLVKDIATMQPKGIGHSIDARIKVFQDDSGKESVVDVVALRSTDLVASAATTDNLFESAILDNKESDSSANKFISDLAKYEVDQKVTSLNIEEGMLKDQAIKRDINRLTWDAEELISSILRSQDKTVAEKKKAVTGILNDLETEITGLLAELSGSESKGENNKMELNDILKDKDLWESIVKKVKEADEYTNLKTANQTLTTEVTESATKLTALEAEKAELIKDKEQLVAENKQLKSEIDTVKAAEAVAAKRAMIDNLIKGAQLPKEVITNLWVEDLMSLQEKKVDDKVITLESQVKQRIEERKKLVVKTGKVTGSGDEFDETENDKDKPKKSTEEALENFTKAIKC